MRVVPKPACLPCWHAPQFPAWEKKDLGQLCLANGLLALAKKDIVMPIMNAWHSLSSESAPSAAGVYELGSAYGGVVYIGRAGNLEERIAQHAAARRNSCIGRNARKFRYERRLAHVTRERELFEDYKRSHGGQIPRCNTQDPSR